MNDALLSVHNLARHFPVRTRPFSRKHDLLKALDGVTFNIAKGETLGLVGESGCGKTTLGRLITLLDRATSGDIIFEGVNIVHLQGAELKTFRQEVQLIFQDPYASLNPRMTAEAIIAEPLRVHDLAKGEDLRKQVSDVMDAVGLRQEHMQRYPHEFSGGQRQRIGIARALALRPKLIVADEPVSALDVSIQAQILNLLTDLQDTFNLTYLFISHDLSVVGHTSDRIAVMYLGKIVELADRDSLFRRPYHPYTEALLSAVPHPNPSQRRDHIPLHGDVPSPIDPPQGCAFHPRCPYKMTICETHAPVLEEKASGHYAACHLKR